MIIHFLIVIVALFIMIRLFDLDAETVMATGYLLGILGWWRVHHPDRPGATRLPPGAYESGP